MNKTFLFSDNMQVLFDEMKKRYKFKWSTSAPFEFESVQSHSIVGIDSDALGGLERYMRDTHAQISANPNLIINLVTANLSTTNFNIDSSFQSLVGVFNKYFMLRSDHYRYSIYGNLFFQACKQIGLNESFQFKSPLVSKDETNLNAVRLSFEEQAIKYQLHQKICSKLHSSSVNRQLNKRQENAFFEFDATNSYIDDCFIACPSLFVLRINLGYMCISDEQKQSITLERLTEDMNNLVKPFYTDDLFKKGVGYVIRLDYSPANNYFAQLVVLFDNRTPQTKKYWASLITDNWTSLLPKGMGAFYNWNETTECDGLGLIKQDNIEGRMLLKHHVIGYIIQSAQYISVKEHDENAIWLKGLRPKSRLQDYPTNLLFGVNDKNAQAHLVTIQTLYTEIGFHLNSYATQEHLLKLEADEHVANFELLKKIEALMVAILYDQRPAYTKMYIADGSFYYEMNPLAIRIWDLGDLFDLLARLRQTVSGAQSDFSIFVVLFYHALVEFCAPESIIYPVRVEQKLNNSICRLLTILRNRLQNRDVRKVLTARKSSAMIKYQNACNQFDSLIKDYKVLAIFALNLWPDINFTFDISTANNEDEKKLFTNHKTYSAMLSKFFKIGQNHPSLSPMVGYFVKWEFSAERGRYAHVILLMNATKISDDSAQLNTIQNYWETKITEGRGVSAPTYISSDRNLFPTQVYHLNHKDSKRCKAFKEAVLGYMIPSLVYHRNSRIMMHNLTFGSELATRVRAIKNIKKSNVNLWPLPRLPKIIRVKEESVIMGSYEQIGIQPFSSVDNTLGMEQTEHFPPILDASLEIIPNTDQSLVPENNSMEDNLSLNHSTPKFMKFKMKSTSILVNDYKLTVMKKLKDKSKN